MGRVITGFGILLAVDRGTLDISYACISATCGPAR